MSVLLNPTPSSVICWQWDVQQMMVSKPQLPCMQNTENNSYATYPQFWNPKSSVSREVFPEFGMDSFGVKLDLSWDDDMYYLPNQGWVSVLLAAEILCCLLLESNPWLCWMFITDALYYFYKIQTKFWIPQMPTPRCHVSYWEPVIAPPLQVCREDCMRACMERPSHLGAPGSCCFRGWQHLLWLLRGAAWVSLCRKHWHQVNAKNQTAGMIIVICYVPGTVLGILHHITSLYFHNPLYRYPITPLPVLSPFYRWRNRGTEG